MTQHDNDQKILSRKALDILIPYLPQLENLEDNNSNSNSNSNRSSFSYTNTT